MGDERFLFSTERLADVARVSRSVGPFVAFWPGKQVIHTQIRCPARHALVHEFIQAFVGGEDRLEPGMRHFVHRDAYQALQAALAGDEGGHGILHAAVSALDDRVLRVRIGANQFIQECHSTRRVIWEGFPVGIVFFVRLVIEVEGHAIGVERGVQVVGISCPCKIDHVLRLKYPAACCPGIFNG